MSKWIDYDAIDYRNDKMHNKSSDFIDGVIYMAQRIEEVPSIDIVRCSECKLNETDDCPMVYYTPLEDGNIETRWWNRPDDFCSWGEREGE